MNMTVLRRVRHLLQTADRCHVEAGRLLKNLLETEGSPEFQKFVAAVPMKTQKAYILIRIASAIDLKIVTETEMRSIGWCKAAQVVNLARTRRKAREAVVYAQTHSVMELEVFLRGDRNGGLVMKTFHLTFAQAEELEQALLAHGADGTARAPINRSNALMEIVRLVNGRSQLIAAA
jgi:hypothetical protein